MDAEALAAMWQRGGKRWAEFAKGDERSMRKKISALSEAELASLRAALEADLARCDAEIARFEAENRLIAHDRTPQLGFRNRRP